jgi:extradiol dioxygenase family protein
MEQPTRVPVIAAALVLAMAVPAQAVTDIHAAHEQPTARGVKFESAPHMIFRHDSGTEEWMAFFTDPDGGMLAVMAQIPG